MVSPRDGPNRAEAFQYTSALQDWQAIRRWFFAASISLDPVIGVREPTPPTERLVVGSGEFPHVFKRGKNRLPRQFFLQIRMFQL